MQYFKLAKFIAFPFGKTLQPTSVNGFKTVCNVIWAIIAGWVQFLVLGFFGVILHITIIGILIGKVFIGVLHFV